MFQMNTASETRHHIRRIAMQTNRPAPQALQIFIKYFCVLPYDNAVTLTLGVNK
jgi:hypothetical protein